jgi:tRNA pseudouridine55 synthase
VDDDARARPPPSRPEAGGTPPGRRAPKGTSRAVIRRAVHGVLLLDKPLGLSSNDALQQAKRLYRAEKAGHTGTLDPLATGLLPLCFGAATKFSQASLDADKAYRATLELGVATSSGDAEGDVLCERPVAVSREQVEAACRLFVGGIEQLPPMHSALKHEGRALYAYARAGIEIERAPRAVTIHAIDIVEWQQDVLVIDVRCSKGTYIRTLAADIGEALGCGAHLSALRRTASGALSLRDAHTLESLAALDEVARDALLLPADTLLADRPEVSLDDEDAGRFLSGLRRRLDAGDAPLVRVYGRERHAFLGSGHIVARELIPTRLLSPLEVQGLLEAPART